MVYPYLLRAKENPKKSNYLKLAKSAAIFLEGRRNRVIIAPHLVKNSDIFIPFRVLFLCLNPIGSIRYSLIKGIKASVRVSMLNQYQNQYK